MRICIINGLSLLHATKREYTVWKTSQCTLVISLTFHIYGPSVGSEQLASMGRITPFQRRHTTYK
jgi:hypothetical protein